MLRRILCVLSLCPLVAFANSLTSYNDVKNAIENGKQISIFMDFSKCTPNMTVSAYYSPKAIMIVKNTIAFSDYHITFNNPHFPNQFTAENMTYKLNQEGALSIKTVVLDPSTFKEKGQQPAVINCEIAKGVQFYSTNE